jgi:hypothetical protein
MVKSTRQRWARAAGLLTLLLGLVSGLRGGPAAAAPADAQTPTFGPVTSMALDNAGGGWGWAGPTKAGGDATLLRLQNGQWQVVGRNDAAGGPIVQLSPTIYEFALTNQPGEGWAIGTGGGPRIWHLTGGKWTPYTHNLARGVSLGDLTVSTDGKAGWLTGKNLDAGTPVLLRLQNGAWTAAAEPENGVLENVAISPDGQSAWGWGPHTRGQAKGVYRWTGGRWQEVTGVIPSQPIIQRIVADNAGNGWIVNPADTLTNQDSVLFRLTANAPVKPIYIDLTSVPRTANAVLYLNDVAVDGLGRGWSSGSVRVIRTVNGADTAVYQPVLLRLVGADVSEVPVDDIATTQGEEPPFVYPLAISPDGAHSWLAANGATYQPPLALFQLREPWGHAKPAAAAPLPGAGQCFAPVPYCLRGVFAAYWAKNGGLDQFGYPVTPELTEAQGNKTYTVQYTERARFEYHPENQPPYDVLLGLLGNTLVESRLQETPFKAVAASTSPGVQWFKETGHNAGAPFLPYWTQHGGLPVFGLPRSEAFDERNAADGKVYKVQYFERNRLEYHPENKGTKFEMLLGLLGVEQFSKTYGYTP